VTVRIKQVPIRKLKAAAYNPRKITRGQLDALKRSLEEYGAVEPAVVNKDDEIIGGHQRVKGAGELGWETYPCVYVALSPAKAKALNLALNRISGEWDTPKLEELLAELDTDALALTGFEEAELEQLLARVSGDGPEAKDPPANPRTKPGDLWSVGEHRLLCGDATSEDDVKRLLSKGDPPILCATDPPYGVGVDHTWRDYTNLQRHGSARSSKVANDDRVDWGAAVALAPGPVLYCWHASQFSDGAIAAIEQAGFVRRQLILWVKTNHPISRSDYHWLHEPCWYAVRKGTKRPWRGGRKQTTVWEASSPIASYGGGGKDDAKTFHPTQKPISLWEIPIRNHLAKGEGVYDPFVGSGTALIAAEHLERRCYAIELEPAWCDVAIERLEAVAGAKAKRSRG
jgi:DNA modification methylase